MKSRVAVVALQLCFIVLAAGCSGRAEVEWTESDCPRLEDAEVNLYVENSGSMDGFMHDGSGFGDAVFGLMTEAEKHAGGTGIFYVNSKIIPVGKRAEDVASHLSVEEFRRAGGDRSTTNPAGILKMVLSKVNKNTVAILASDCILALPQGAAKLYLRRSEIETEAVVSRKLKEMPDLAIVAHRMMSNFRGKFYRGALGSVFIDARRPYYLIVAGPAELVSQLEERCPLGEVPGADVTCSVAYWQNPDGRMTVTNSTGRQFDNGKCTLLAVDDGNGGRSYMMSILADLRPWAFDRNGKPGSGTKYVEDKHNFTCTHSQLRVESIRPLQGKAEFQTGYTHVINIIMPVGVRPEAQVAVTMKRQPQPLWIAQASDDTGVEIGRKTTGIKQFLYGIGKAFENGSENDALRYSFAIKK